MNVHYADPGQLSPAAVEAWAELGERAVQPNAFADPAFVLAACRHLAGGSALRLLVAQDGQEWVGCLPLQAAGHWHKLPRRAVTDWHHLSWGSSAPLLREGRAPEAAEALLDHLVGAPGADGSRPRVLGLSELTQGPAAEALLEAAARRRLPVLLTGQKSRAAVVRRADSGDYLSGLSSKRRSELRRRRRRLCELLGADVGLVDRSSEPEALEAFISLEAAGWKSRAGTALVQQPGQVDFYRDMCSGFRAAGRLHLWSLEAPGSTPLAMACRIQAGGTLFTLKIAYDEAHAAAAPGVVAEVEAMLKFHENPRLTLLDSCTDPTNELLNELYPDRLEVVDVAIGLGRPLDRLLLGAYPRLRDVETLLRRTASMAPVRRRRPRGG